MTRTSSIRIAGSVVLLGALAIFAACAEGSSQPVGSSTGSGDGGSSNPGNGGNGNGGDDDGGKQSSSKSSSNGSSSTSGSSSGGDGGGGGIGPSVCGNAVCDAGENCATCPNDCTENCGEICGDGFCNGSDTCSTCAQDCGECTQDCGNGVCDAAEAQTCPQDCQGGQGSTFAGGGGMCPPDPCQAGGSADAMCLDFCVLTVCATFAPECCEGEWTDDCVMWAELATGIGVCSC